MDCRKILTTTMIVTAICVLIFAITVSAEYAVITGNGVNFRTEPNTDCAIHSVLPLGTVVSANGSANGWVSITYNGKSGYIFGQYIRVGEPVITAPNGSAGSNVVEYAKQFVGTPYQYGGAAPGGFDCSGFTSYVYKQFGYSLNRTASGQASNGVAVSRENLAPGDLVMFDTYGGISHVAIYMGNDQIIHAKRSGIPLGIDTLSSDYYNSRYVCARRIIQ